MERQIDEMTIKEFVEKLHVEFRMYGSNDKFNKEMFLTAVDKVADKMKKHNYEKKKVKHLLGSKEPIQ